MRRRTFLKQSLTAAATASALTSPAKLLAESLANQQKPLKEFSYGDVRLAPGPMLTQFLETQAVLLGMNEDSLLKPWRLRAGLPAPGPELGGWYDELILVKTAPGGHGFAPAHSTGQWISALARGYAVTGNPETKAKLESILEQYEPVISPKFYANFRYPAYNYDKMVCGLMDAYQFGGIQNAYTLLDKVTDAAAPHLPPHALDRDEPQRKWRASVGESTVDDYTWDESYTMPENLYLAAQRAPSPAQAARYRAMAPKYLLNETWFDPLSENKNVLPNHHAYSFCNSLSSAMQAYLSDGSEKHLRAASNAFDMLVNTQSYATGGWGPDESFREPNTGALYDSLTNSKHSFETPCGSYAHFKLTRYLLRVTRDSRYGDSMERVLYNTVLGAKPLEPDGHAFYYSDYSNTGNKFYFDDRWPCCSGTLPQVAADYHILGYFHDADGVYVNLYTPSTLKWKAANGARLALTQSSNYPIDGRIAIVLKTSKATNLSLRLRIPAWSHSSSQSVSISVNGQAFPAPIEKGFATINRKWKDDDRVEINIPLPMRLEAIDPQHPETVALMRGPLVLFAMTDTAPKVTRDQLLAAKAMPGQSVWMANTSSGPLLLAPFTGIHEEKYKTYLTVS
jgi:DUF1680 family protein